jgi:hypothetical protein
MRKIFFSLIAIVGILLSTSCTNEESVDIDDINTQTTLVYMPWSGSTSSSGLYSYFLQNLDSIEQAIIENKGVSGRVLVFLSTSAESSSLYELSYAKDSISHIPLKTYSGNLYTTAEGITEILNDVKENAYALNYAIMIGCHGCGWTYKDDWTDYPYKAKQFDFNSSDATMAKGAGVTNTPNYPMTRFFGSVSSTSYATDIETLAEGIAGAGMTMQFILFDDCYMANIETAYALRNVTNYLIASTSEVLAVGMPYQTMFTLLAKQEPNYSSAISAFDTFYSNYTYPYGTLSAIDCRETEELADIMKEINHRYTLPDSLRDSIQVLGGFEPNIFYDLGNYVDSLCKDNVLLSDFHSRLDNVVKYTCNTDTIYSYLYLSGPKYIKVKATSGITISDPSINSVALTGREKTAWWSATHQ